MQLKYDKYKYKNYDRQKSRVKRVVKLYARQLLQKVTNWQQLAYVYDRSIKPEYAEARIKKILRHREVQNMLTEEIAKLYEENQITPDKVIKDEIMLRDLAVDKKDLTNFNKVLDKWRDSLQMLPVKNQITETYEENYVKLLEDNSKETRKLRAKQTKQLQEKQAKQLPATESNEETGNNSE